MINPYSKAKSQVNQTRLDQLKQKCLQLQGVEKVRKASRGDGCFVYFREILLSSGMFWKPRTFVFLEGWEDSLKMASIEYAGRYNELPNLTATMKGGDIK